MTAFPGSVADPRTRGTGIDVAAISPHFSRIVCYSAGSIRQCYGAYPRAGRVAARSSRRIKRRLLDVQSSTPPAPSGRAPWL